MRYLYIFAFLVFLNFTVNVKAQQTSKTYNTPYHTDNQNLWQPGAGGLFTIDQDFFGFNWNDNTTVGNITSISGQNFGAEISAGTWGELGSGITINFGNENVDIDYNADMNIDYPTISTFQAGDEVVFNTDWSPLSSGTGITPDMYDVNMALWLRMGMGFDMSAKLCTFGCSNNDIFDVDLPVDNYDLIELSSANGVTLLDGMMNFPPTGNYPSGFFPFVYSDPTGTITLTLNLPDNTGPNATTYLNGNDLLYRNNTQYLDMYFSIANFIGALNIPYVSQLFGNLTNSWNNGPFSLSYTLLDAGFDLGLHNKQYLRFDPEMYGKLEFPDKIDYRVVDPYNGSVISSGYDSVINYQPGQDVKIDFPCHYDFMDVVPSFRMENQFSNHTYDSISFDFVFKALSFEVNVKPTVVVPEVCVPTYKACGPRWCRVCKWCKSGEICTPPVKFDGYNASFGPLVEITPNLYNTHYDWVNNSWEMQGFNSYDSLAPIYLEPADFNLSTVSSNVLCHGGNSGQATATVSNGRPPYTYHWSNGVNYNTHQNNHSVNNLSAGTHYVSVTDDNGCMVFTDINISQPEKPLTMDTSVNHLSCNNSGDGKINVATKGGTSPYSFMWSGGQTTDSISGLSAGNHTIVITDANGCSLSETFYVTQPQELSVVIDSENVLCHGDSTGVAEAIVSGGTTPYYYNWSNGDTTSVNNNIAAGVYELTVTDQKGCTASESINIVQPSDSLVLDTIVNDVLCNGDNTGSIEVLPSGGQNPYTYSWYNENDILLNQTSNILDSIQAGTYTCIAEDINGCSEEVTVTIKEPAKFEYNISVTDVLCYGDATGMIDITLSGATPPFTYAWSDGSTNEDLDSVKAGIYDLSITDDNNCQYTINATISQPEEPLKSVVEIQNVRCYGFTDGKIEVNTSGGTEPYTYIWSDSTTTAEVTNVPAGVYSVTVTDAHACINYSGGEVKQPDAPLDMTSTIADASCFGYNDGSILVEISGGTIPYNIVWDDDEFVVNNKLHKLKNLGAGIYNIILKDKNDCSFKETYKVEQPLPVNITFQTGIVSCFGGSDGYIETEVSGGTTPYIYDWSNGSQNEDPDNLSAGVHYLELTDNHNCIVDTSVTIDSYPPLIVDYSIKPKSCKDKEDAGIEVFPSGGTEEFNYTWSNGEKSKDVYGLDAGNYSLTVTDTNSCVKIIEVDIRDNDLKCINIPTSFTPNGDSYNDKWVIRNIDTYPDALVQVYRKDGRLVFEADGSYEPWDGKFEGKDLPSGTYYYVVNLKNEDDPYTGSLTILR